MTARASRSGALLVELGYTNMIELDGGMSAWESAGHELLQKQ